MITPGWFYKLVSLCYMLKTRVNLELEFDAMCFSVDSNCQLLKKDIINRKLLTCFCGKNHIVGAVLTHGCASEKRCLIQTMQWDA